MIRRIAAIAATLVLACTGTLAASPDFPERPVTLVVPFPPGQSADIVARFLADELTRKWKVAVIVQNRGGGNTIPGMVAGRDAPPDGHTLTLAANGSMAMNPSLIRKLPYDPLKDFAVIGGLYIQPYVVVANTAAPFDTIAAMVAAMKASPGKYSWGATGIAQRVIIELIKRQAKVDAAMIPYTGSGPGLTGLLGGEVPLLLDSLASALPLVKAGKVKILAVTTSERVPQLPDVKTLAEQGLTDLNVVGWVGLVAPKGTPPVIVKRISGDVHDIVDSAAFRDELISRGAIPDASRTAEWRAFLDREVTKWSALIRAANIELE